MRLGKYAAFAAEGVAFEQGSAAVRGDVGVNGRSAGPFLRNNVEASFSQNSAMQDSTSRVLADINSDDVAVRKKAGASIAVRMA